MYSIIGISSSWTSALSPSLGGIDSSSGEGSCSASAALSASSAFLLSTSFWIVFVKSAKA